ncbi:hypothetical protein AB5J62_07580 [Amycolatopsis sp. cg5]|uniref:hypothetical protein n=1 Tax=Amycolatopsis sp. cg5 TaxID=3238802 RepID=UPI0035263438
MRTQTDDTRAQTDDTPGTRVTASVVRGHGEKGEPVCWLPAQGCWPARTVSWLPVQVAPHASIDHS